MPHADHHQTDQPAEPERDTVHVAWEAARSRHRAPPDFADRVMRSLKPEPTLAPRGSLARLLTPALSHPIGRAALIAVAVTACAFRIAQVMRLLLA